MRASLAFALIIGNLPVETRATEKPARALPAVAAGWSVELVEEAPRILYPTAIVAAPDGALYLGSDPMDMPGPPTAPIDRVVAIRDGRITTFADKLWSVMGLEWSDGTLYVVQAPFLSAFRDCDGDGKSDERIDLMTGLGPQLPGFNGLNDHIATGLRLGMDGYLYIAVGDKGIPRGVGRDGTTIRLSGGGVIRIRPDGTGLEVVSTGERNPLSVALTATDDVFTYGNDDDSKQWPNSLTHHIVGGHYGYPYVFLGSPRLALPIVAGQIGGSGTQGLCYNEDGLPAEYRGNLFFCDWGLQSVRRFEIRKAGGTFAVARRTELVTKGEVADFRPFSLAVAADGASLWLVDWAYDGWLAPGPKTGRLYRLRYAGPDRVRPAPRPSGRDAAVRLRALDHPALAVRLESQRILARLGPAAVPLLLARLTAAGSGPGRLHALWALDAIGGPEARRAIGSALSDLSAPVRLQAVRSSGLRRDRAVLPALARLLKDRDAAIRREAAIALGKLGDPEAAPALYAALDESDPFAAWSVRRAIRRLEAWDRSALVAALLDERRVESALTMTEDAWSVPVVEALTEALRRAGSVAVRARIVANLSGLYRGYPEWTGSWFGTNPLAGRFPEKTRDWLPEGMAAVLRGLALGLVDRDSAVRFQAIVGLGQAGRKSAPALRAALAREPDPRNQAALAETLGRIGDAASTPTLAVLLTDPRYPEPVRASALRGLATFRDPQALRARFTLIYDPNAPPSLVARALPELAGSGLLPPNDLASFLENPSPEVRAAALLSLNVKKTLPADLKLAVLDRLEDPAPEAREAATLAVVALRLHEAVPRLMARVAEPEAPDWAATIAALCRLPDPRALSLYLAAIQDRNPQLRRAGESALLALRDRVPDQLAAAARSTPLTGPAALSLDRVLARFEPIREWRVIGPFPRTIPQIFLGQKAIDFARVQAGAGGQPVVWAARRADPASGRVDLEDLKRGSGERGGFGYDATNSPDLGAFAYAELDSQADRPALMLLGSSGTLIVTVNERPVAEYVDFAGRAYVPDSDLVRIHLVKGRNRILVVSRQGIGRWAFGVQVAPTATRAGTSPAGSSPATIEALRRFALHHDGDPRRGEEIFFDPRGIGCARCHSAGGQGTATIGPDLTGLAAKYDRAELIRSVLEPSSRIATGYQPAIVATRDGRILTGVVRTEADDWLELADAEAKVTRIPRSAIDERRVGSVSIMPADLVEALAPIEFADLISFLATLRQAPRPPSAAAQP
jgi:putative heme-binding domain-containing protein